MLHTDINKILFFDGILFAYQGIAGIVFPNVHRELKTREESKFNTPAFRDLAREIGWSKISIAVLLEGLAFTIKNSAELNVIAQFRAFSLVFVLVACIMKIMGKRWQVNGSLLVFITLYSILILAYIFLGLVDPVTV